MVVTLSDRQIGCLSRKNDSTNLQPISSKRFLAYHPTTDSEQVELKEDDMRHQENPDLNLWLREAKVLHRAAKSKSLAQSLPVLRRLLNSNVLTNISLIQLKQSVDIIQRKHLLNMLAIENGSFCWADFKQKLINEPNGSIIPSSIELKNAGYPVLWFSTPEEASLYTDKNGGRVVRVGTQAVVISKSN